MLTCFLGHKNIFPCLCFSSTAQTFDLWGNRVQDEIPTKNIWITPFLGIADSVSSFMGGAREALISVSSFVPALIVRNHCHLFTFIEGLSFLTCFSRRKTVRGCSSPYWLSYIYYRCPQERFKLVPTCLLSGEDTFFIFLFFRSSSIRDGWKSFITHTRLSTASPGNTFRSRRGCDGQKQRGDFLWIINRFLSYLVCKVCIWHFVFTSIRN